MYDNMQNFSIILIPKLQIDDSLIFRFKENEFKVYRRICITMRRHAVFLRYSVYSMSHMKLGQAKSLFPRKRKMRTEFNSIFPRSSSLRLAPGRMRSFFFYVKTYIHTRVYAKLIYKRGTKNFSILFICL